MRKAEAYSREHWWREWPLPLAVLTLTLALLAKGWITTALGQPATLAAVLAVICGVILAAAVAIVRHADVLARRLGEPAGTLLLTLTITGLEVAMVAFVMSTGAEKPTLARDTMFAVVMLVLNGFMGLALLLGGLRHREQPYNLQSANAFLVMILSPVSGSAKSRRRRCGKCVRGSRNGIARQSRFPLRLSLRPRYDGVNTAEGRIPPIPRIPRSMAFLAASARFLLVPPRFLRYDKVAKAAIKGKQSQQ